jgi:hypothetical protein
MEEQAGFNEAIKGENTYSIQIDITNASNEYRAALYRILNKMSFEAPGVFSYHTLGLDAEENKAQINNNNE